MGNTRVRWIILLGIGIAPITTHFQLLNNFLSQTTVESLNFANTVAEALFRSIGVYLNEFETKFLQTHTHLAYFTIFINPFI